MDMHGYIGLCTAICCYVAIRRAVYGSVWLCKAKMYGSVPPCMAMRGNQYGYVRLCTAMYGCVRLCAAMHG